MIDGDRRASGDFRIEGIVSSILSRAEDSSVVEVVCDAQSSVQRKGGHCDVVAFTRRTVRARPSRRMLENLVADLAVGDRVAVLAPRAEDPGRIVTIIATLTKAPRP